MKHILIYGMTDNPGGIETYLLNFFLRVQDKLVHLDFVSDFPAIAHSHILEEQGAKLFFIPAKSKNLFGHLSAMWRILKSHKEYEAVYFNILDAGAAVTMIPVFLLGRKIVVHSHNNSTDKLHLHRICKPLLNLLTAERAACSEPATEYMFGRKAKSALVVPNAIDAACFSFSEQTRNRKRQELNLGDRPCICHVGRITRQKNPLGLIDIFEAVHRKCPEAVLLSVGNGDMMEQFREYIARKGLSDAVVCLGARKDVDEIYQAADVFLLPSLYEGLPIAVLEAQAAGLPCVISDVIPKQAAVTDLVCRVSLDESPQEWADRVIERFHTIRRDTYQELIEAGFDISCCDRFDVKLIAMFGNER